MKRVPRTLTLACGLLCSSSAFSANPYSDQSNEQGWTPNAAFTDEFSTTALNTTKWQTTCTTGPGEFWQGRNPSSFDPANVTIQSDGLVYLKTKNVNKLSNGSFEVLESFSDNAGWKTVTGTPQVWTVPKKRGQYGLAIKGAGVLQQQVSNLTPNTTYKLSGYIRVLRHETDTSALARLEVTGGVAAVSMPAWESTHNGYLYQETSLPDPGYVKVVLFFKTNTGVSQATIKVSNYGSSNSETVVYADEISVVQRQQPTGLTMGNDNYITAACLQTKAKAPYGYYEVKARAANGAHCSSFWFQGACSEIDVFEIVGKPSAILTNKSIPTNLHYFRGGWKKPAEYAASIPNANSDEFSNDMPAPVTLLAPGSLHLAESYHHYGVEWNPDWIKWYYDGEVIRTSPNFHNTEIEYLYLDTEVMEHYGLPEDGYDQNFTVEYVRAWTKSGTPANSAYTESGWWPLDNYEDKNTLVPGWDKSGNLKSLKFVGVGTGQSLIANNARIGPNCLSLSPSNGTNSIAQYAEVQYPSGVSALTDSNTNMGTADFAVSAWFHRRSSSSNATYIFAKGVPGTHTFYGAHATNTHVTVTLRNGAQTPFTLTVPISNLVNNWHHLAVNFDRDNLMSVYVDGQYQQSVNISGLINANFQTSIPLTIGCASDFSSAGRFGFWPGMIDDVRVYKHLLTPQQITLLTNSPAAGCTPGGAQGWWLLEPTNVLNGTQAADISGNVNHAVLVNSPAYVSGRKSGTKSLSMNGTTQYATVADADSLDIGADDFSISAWFYLSQYQTGNRRLLSKVDGSKGYMLYASDTNKLTLALYHGGNVRYVTGTHTGAQQWSHVAVNIKRDGNMTLYINGAAAQNVSIADWETADISNALPLVIGGNSASPAGQFWPGKIQDLRIYKRVLNQAEITLLSY